MQQYLLNQEQPPCALAAAQDLNTPNLYISVADMSARHAPEHDLQQYLPNDEQAPPALTTVQDVIWPAVSLDSWLADASAQDADPDPEPLLALPEELPLPFAEHDLQQYFPNCEQAPVAFTAAQDLILPADSLDTWLADASTQEKPDPEPLLALPEELPLPLLEP